MKPIITKYISLNLGCNQRTGKVFIIFFCLFCCLSCSHTPPPEQRQLSDKFYKNMLIAFSARDYDLVKIGLQKINEAGIENKKTLYLEAMVALMEQKPEKAVPALKAALVIDPNYAEAHNTLGSIYMQQKLFAAAEAEFVAASNNRLYQTPEKAYHNLGNLYHMQDKNEQASGCYLKAIGFNSDYFPSHYELSSLYFSMNKFELAAQEIEKARQISPEHPGVWFQIGVIEKARQKTPQAIEAFKQVIKLQPSGSFANRATKELNIINESR